MIGTLMRYIVIAIVLGIIGEVISHLSSKSKTIDKNVSTTHYRVKAPVMLKYACMAQFLFGMIMFILFSYFYMKGNETVEMGHLYFSSIFGIIGLYGVIWASIWGVKVNDSQLEIHRIFRAKKGKKLIKIDALSDNYDYLLDSLKLNNIKILNKRL